MNRRTALGALLTSSLGRAAEPPPTPVLVELFTSEGCSSCPPADQLLDRLDREQPVRGASIMVLSEHVDYWNRLGWRDPFSLAQFSRRQEAYARRFGREGPYTPQMIVNGEAAFVGNDPRRALQAIAAAARKPHDAVRIENGQVRVEGIDAAVWFAIAVNTAASHVLRGENSGRHLQHTAVVRSLIQAGTAKRHRPFTAPVPRIPSDCRFIAFAQRDAAGPILGAALLG